MTRWPVRHRPLILTFVVGLAGLVGPACARPTNTPPAEGEPVAVATSRVSLDAWPAQIEAGGVLRARFTAAISSRILAPIAALSVRAGDRVTAGQPLVVLDDAALRADAARARAAADATDLAAIAARADERGAVAALTLARTNHDRIATLLSQRSATRQELDEATAALDEAESRATAAGARSRSAASALEAARAAAESANVAVTYATLAAPFGGRVIDRRVDPGTMAVPGSPLVVIEDPASLQLEVTLDASRASLATPRQPVAIRVDSDAADSPWVDGCVTEISRIDPASHSFAVKIDVPPNPAWRSGLFGRARFAGPARQALIVPATAVVRRGQLTFVFVVTADGRAELRAVSPGETTLDRTELLSGASAGETIIVRPPAGLSDGARVTTSGGGR